MVFQILNRLKWTKKLNDAEITILHRGAQENRKKISGKDVTEVKRSYFLVMESGKETFIPNHRILEIKLGGKSLWRRVSKA